MWVIPHKLNLLFSIMLLFLTLNMAVISTLVYAHVVDAGFHRHLGRFQSSSMKQTQSLQQHHHVSPQLNLVDPSENDGNKQTPRSGFYIKEGTVLFSRQNKPEVTIRGLLPHRTEISLILH